MGATSVGNSPTKTSESERLYTLEEMKKAYEWGQIDCGEFFNIMGFEHWETQGKDE